MDTCPWVKWVKSFENLSTRPTHFQHMFLHQGPFSNHLPLPVYIPIPTHFSYKREDVDKIKVVPMVGFQCTYLLSNIHTCLHNILWILWESTFHHRTTRNHFEQLNEHSLQTWLIFCALAVAVLSSILVKQMWPMGLRPQERIHLRPAMGSWTMSCLLVEYKQVLELVEHWIVELILEQILEL